MKILVLGGTGAMGQYLCDLLAARGEDVFVTTRQVRQNRNNITYLIGNAHNSSFLSKILKTRYGAIIDFMSYNTEEFKNRVDMFLYNTDQYIFISSCRIYADCSGAITEDSPRLLDVCQDFKYLKTDEYALSKARQEDFLKASGKKNWTIVRPPKTYGEGRLQLGSLEKEDWLYRAINDRPIIFCQEVSDRCLNLTNGFDVSRAICELVGNDSSLGEVYHVTTEKLVTWGGVLEIYLDVLETHLGRRPQVKMISLRDFERYTSSKYQLKYSTLLDRKFDNKKIAQFIDVTSFIAPEVGLKKYLQLFLEEPYFKRVGRFTIARQNIALKEGRLKDYIIVFLVRLMNLIK